MYVEGSLSLLLELLALYCTDTHSHTLTHLACAHAFTHILYMYVHALPHLPMFSTVRAENPYTDY